MKYFNILVILLIAIILFGCLWDCKYVEGFDEPCQAENDFCGVDGGGECCPALKCKMIQGAPLYI